MTPRLLNLEHVLERARLHGIQAERLETHLPTVSLHPCPYCQDGFDALAEWDGLGIITVCNGCQDHLAITAALLADPPTSGEVDAPADGLRFATLREFIAVEEPASQPLLGTPEETIIAAGGDVLTYGAGGAGKTTWVVDGVFHLAGGVAWNGFAVPRPMNVVMVENEGPRAKFRQKLDRKAATWTGPDVFDRIHLLEDPWAGFTFGDAGQRDQLAAFLNQTRADLLVSGPISTLGMVGGGTPDEINSFMALLRELRKFVDHPVAWWGVHHENRAGQVSGAWERVPDTLVHITPRGNGHTRVFWQKARWSSDTHQTTTNLAWRDGWTYEVEEPDEPVTAERIWDDLAKYVTEHGGTGWNKADTAVPGKGTLKRETRDRMLADGVLVNAGNAANFKLWHRDDPARPSGDAPGDAP
jgi:AAA domain